MLAMCHTAACFDFVHDFRHNTTLVGQSTNHKSAWGCSTVSETDRALGGKCYAFMVVNSNRVQSRLWCCQPRVKVELCQNWCTAVNICHAH
jgi:hypothetical protein